MITKIILIWLAISLIVSLLLCWLVRRSGERDHRYRRMIDDGIRHKDVEAREAVPGGVLTYEHDDGLPGGPRGRVWTEKKRAEYRRARQRLKMRVIQ